MLSSCIEPCKCQSPRGSCTIASTVTPYSAAVRSAGSWEYSFSCRSKNRRSRWCPGPLQPHSRNRSATVAPLSRPLSTLPGPMACSSWLRSQPLRGGSTGRRAAKAQLLACMRWQSCQKRSLPGNCCSRSCRQRSGSLQIRTGGCPSARSTTQPGSSGVACGSGTPSSANRR